MTVRMQRVHGVFVQIIGQDDEKNNEDSSLAFFVHLWQQIMSERELAVLLSEFDSEKKQILLNSYGYFGKIY